MDNGGTGTSAESRFAKAATPFGGSGGTLPVELLDPANMLAIADLLPVMIAFIDEQHVVRFMNVPLCEWMGKPRDEMVGRHMREVVGEQTYSDRQGILAAAFAGQRQWFVSEFDHPARGPLAIQNEYVPWTGPQATIRGVIVMITDMTEQRAAERALRESEARFRRIANAAPAMMWVTRSDKVRDFVNDAYAEFIGLKGEPARLFDWRGAIHPDDRDRVLGESLAGEESGKPFTIEARFRRADGEYRWLRSVSTPRFDAEGHFRGYIGVASDISVAKEAELKLKQEVEERTAKLAASEARFRAIFDTVQEVVVLLDTRGNIVELNRKEAAWRDRDARKAIGQKVWESATLKAYPQHIPMIREAVRKAARGEAFSAEVPMERPGVATSYLDLSIQPVRDEDGKVIFLLLEARDVTDLKAAQEQLRQSQKMEALGQLTGGIAHDFNNLLTVVVGGLDIICKRAEEPKLKRYAENAMAAAERGARLTGQLLAFSRVQRLEVMPTRVTPLMEGMRPLLRNVLGPGIEKRFELDDADLRIMADPTQLEVAVLNLAINARDAMSDGGILTFRTRAVHVRSDPELDEGDYVELSIGDTGTGMTEDVAARAFEPFFTTKEVGKGTGLGLSMVYGMARQSGGTARVESRAGEGTTVKLLFRVATDAGEEPLPADTLLDAEDEEAARASILVIDDDPDVREYVVASLEEQGFDVRGANDGPAGLRLFSRQAFDLVVLDFIMPGMSGAEVASSIRVQRPEQPILFVSGYSETEAVRRVAPDAPLLPKPFRTEALLKAVRSGLSG
jgi:PAS domain S-box-containing protein